MPFVPTLLILLVFGPAGGVPALFAAVIARRSFGGRFLAPAFPAFSCCSLLLARVCGRFLARSSQSGYENFFFDFRDRTVPPSAGGAGLWIK
jgi:hypothetical protein